MKYNLVLEKRKVLHTNIIISSQISFAWQRNGERFPIGGILIAPHFEASWILGTTGGSHLASQAAA
jgi:hypothetical protein